MNVPTLKSFNKRFFVMNSQDSRDIRPVTHISSEKVSEGFTLCGRRFVAYITELTTKLGGGTGFTSDPSHGFVCDFRLCHHLMDAAEDLDGDRFCEECVESEAYRTLVLRHELQK